MKSRGSLDSVANVQESVSLFTHRPFVFFWLARVFSAVSLQVSMVAVGWQVYALTGSVFKLGMVGLAQFLPMVVLSVAAGNLADRFDRREIVRACQAVMGCAVGVLAVKYFTGALDTAEIFTVVAILGASRSFEHPTMSALLPNLVGESLLPRAAARMASATQTAYIIGPALGGLLYTASPTVAYGVAAALFFSAGFCTTLIRTGHPPSLSVPGGPGSLFSGITFIWNRPAVLGAISLDLFAVLLGGATALLPVYAHDILHTGPWGLGILRSAPAAGALSMSFILSHHPIERRIGQKMFAGVIVFGVATLVFAVSRSLLLSMGALVVLGAADVVSVVVRMPLVQIATPDRMRGRVSAVNSLFVGTSNQLGEFESGVTAALLGTVPAVLVGGLGTIAVALLWMRLFPELLHADRFERAEGA